MIRQFDKLVNYTYIKSDTEAKYKSREKGFLARSLYCTVHVASVLDLLLIIGCIVTSAGNLFKFCCRASTEYQVDVSD